METTHVRIKLSTYNKLRRIFPSKKDETLAQYWDRLTEWVFWARLTLKERGLTK